MGAVESSQDGLQGVDALVLPQPLVATRPGAIAERTGMVPEEISGQVLQSVSSRHETPVSSVSPPCQRCADAGEYAPASVRFAGEIVCSFHAYSAWYDKPARVYARAWA
jgi:hypothetical protein